MYEIAVPKLNNNDATYVLVEWLYEDGAVVPDGAPVAVLETSKATEEIVCERGGVLHHIAEPAHECLLGQVIGRVYADEDERRRHVDGRTPGEGPAAAWAEFVITNPARDLIATHGVTVARLRSLRKRVIKHTDVEKLLAADAVERDGERDAAVPLDRGQLAVGEVVSRSHRTIPAAFLAVKVRVAAALDAARELSAREGVVVGLPSLLIKAVSLLHGEYPLFFARLLEDGTALPARRPDVGITVDVGTGLFIPALDDPSGRSVADIAAALTSLRITAMRRGFSGQELRTGSITVALQTEDGVVIAQPLVLPDTACMVSLCAVHEELVLAAGRVTTAPYVHLGLAYDHRLINGREAAAFLGRIRDALERPESLHAVVAQPTSTTESR